MIIRLYKDCILTNKYTEVIDQSIVTDGKSAFDRYIESLPHRDDIEVDGYTGYKGSFVISNQNFDIMQYNYMRIVQTGDDGTDFVIYAFIQSIELKNKVAKITYECDYWHSFIQDCDFRTGYITNARALKDDWFAKYAIEPISNEGLDYEPLSGDGNVPYMLITIQIYTTQEGGSNGFRYCKNVILTENDGLTPKQFNSYKDLYKQIDKILTLQGSKVLKGLDIVTALTGAYYYEIKDIFLISTNYFDRIVQLLSVTDETYFTEDSTGQYTMKFACLRDSVVPMRFYVKTLPAYLTRIGLLGDDIIPLPFNKKNYKIELSVFNSMNGFQFYLNTGGKIYDITKAFIFNIPYSKVNGTENQLRKLVQAQAETKALTSAVGFGVSALSTVAGGFMVGTGVGGMLGAGMIAGGISGMVSQAGTSINASREAERQYQDSYLKNNQNMPISVMYGDLLELSYYNIDNGNEINDITDECGYSVNEVVKSLYYTSNISNFSYNIVKFSFVRIAGKVPQDILDKLQNILIQGTKIWYTENVNI